MKSLAGDLWENKSRNNISKREEQQESQCYKSKNPSAYQKVLVKISLNDFSALTGILKTTHKDYL